MAQGKGLYGQQQGNERRQASMAALGHFADNRIAEGDVVDEIRHTMRHPHLWPVTAVLVESLRRFVGDDGKTGYSDHRIQMILGQASYGMNI